MKTNNQLVYFFGNGKAEGSAKQKFLLGGKGANLAEMTRIGIPVPAGFTISTNVCKYYYEKISNNQNPRNKQNSITNDQIANEKFYPDGLKKEVEENIKKLEEVTGKSFGSVENPLLVSVRSGAASSMPGMMDTILNLGLNEKVVEAIASKTGNARFAWDSYRRFVQMYSNVVENIEHEKFEHVISTVKKESAKQNDVEMTDEDWKKVVAGYKEIFRIHKGREFPDKAEEQLWGAIGAVIGSWNNERAKIYRKLNKIDETKVYGTAVNVQSMVFGNMGDDCGTGVAFTRNPSTGENKPYGEYLMNAQGEDVVAGIRTPKTLASLKDDNDKVYAELLAIFKKLEDHYADMQDVEFTIENGKLFILQTRNGKRTAFAAVRVAVELVAEGKITEKEAVCRVDAGSLDQLLHPTLQASEKKNYKVIATGLPASPGAASGEVVFTAERAVELADEGRDLILVRAETSPEDLAGMNVAKGILTARGGMTSHAAVVARGMGKCCVSGCEEIIVSEADKVFRSQFSDLSYEIHEGDIITLDGSTGEVFLGKVPTEEASLSGDFGKLMSWVDKYRTMGVRTNADTPKDAQVARDFGAQGIGLCRTEHMFFEEDRIFAVRQMIVAETVEQRKIALEKIFPMQKNDFKKLFEIMKGLPVKIRLLDPPLHEFLPKNQPSSAEASAGKEDIAKLAKEMGVSESVIREKIDLLHEFNPMMGHRGCRLGITYPEIFEMQVRAIIAAAAEISISKKQFPNKSQDTNHNDQIIPEIMIPLIADVAELKWLKSKLIPVIEATMEEYGVKLKYEIGTMIEIPRACVTADEIAVEAEFFSFGTNDLTQMTYGFSRDDAGKFLKEYVNQKILKEDPFRSVDQQGVGKLMKMAIDLGRSAKQTLNVGICGEQGGDPDTVKFCHKIGLNYVSCSPYRVPIARLAAAQAAIENL